MALCIVWIQLTFLEGLTILWVKPSKIWGPIWVLGRLALPPISYSNQTTRTSGIWKQQPNVDKIFQEKTIPIGSMGLVYLPTFSWLLW